MESVGLPYKRGAIRAEELASSTGIADTPYIRKTDRAFPFGAWFYYRTMDIGGEQQAGAGDW